MTKTSPSRCSSAGGASGNAFQRHDLLAGDQARRLQGGAQAALHHLGGERARRDGPGPARDVGDAAGLDAIVHRHHDAVLSLGSKTRPTSVTSPILRPCRVTSAPTSRPATEPGKYDTSWSWWPKPADLRRLEIGVEREAGRPCWATGCVLSDGVSKAMPPSSRARSDSIWTSMPPPASFTDMPEAFQNDVSSCTYLSNGARTKAWMVTLLRQIAEIPAQHGADLEVAEEDRRAEADRAQPLGLAA